MSTRTLEPCGIDDIGLEVNPDANLPAKELAEAERIRDKLLAQVREYLRQFAKPEPTEAAAKGTAFTCGSHLCACGKGLDGMFGTFQWGLAHGEGYCTSCGHPVRMYHRIDLGDDGKFEFSLPLLYLPTEEVV